MADDDVPRELHRLRLREGLCVHRRQCVSPKPASRNYLYLNPTTPFSASRSAATTGGPRSPISRASKFRRVSGGTVRPCAESSISCPRRLSFVVSVFAVMTHQTAAFWYDGGCARKNSQAFRFARNFLNCVSSSSATLRCSYE